jgi:hypothetical protein
MKKKEKERKIRGKHFVYQQRTVLVIPTKIQNPRRFASARDWFIFLRDFVVCLRCKYLEKLMSKTIANLLKYQ